MRAINSLIGEFFYTFVKRFKLCLYKSATKILQYQFEKWSQINSRINLSVLLAFVVLVTLTLSADAVQPFFEDRRPDIEPYSARGSHGLPNSRGNSIYSRPVDMRTGKIDENDGLLQLRDNFINSRRSEMKIGSNREAENFVPKRSGTKTL